MKCRLLALCFVAIFSFSIFGLAQGLHARTVAIGVSYGYPNIFSDSSLAYSIDLESGAVVLLGPTGFSHFNSLAATSTGMIFSADDSNLVRINARSGVGQLSVPIIGDIEPSRSIRAMAFSKQNVLHAINYIGQLYTIETATGYSRLVGNTGYTHIQSLEFGRDGTLYAWDVRQGLLTINPSTGIATDVNLSFGATADIQTIAFAPNGLLYGGRNEIYEISPATGRLTLVKVLGSIPLSGLNAPLDIRGLYFVPEPSAALTFFLGLLCIISHRSLHSTYSS